jgi:hypothetical protein
VNSQANDPNMIDALQGASITGVAVRIDQRIAAISTGDGGNWRVPFHMLRRMLDI